MQGTGVLGEWWDNLSPPLFLFCLLKMVVFLIIFLCCKTIFLQTSILHLFHMAVTLLFVSFYYKALKEL